VILSERDWALVEDWYRRGIPLQIIEEAIDAAASRRGRGEVRPPRGLAYVARAVEEAWRTLLDGRVGDCPDDRPANEAAPAGSTAWRRRLVAESENSLLRRLLATLLEALDSGMTAEEVDARLDREIADAVPSVLRSRVEDEVERELRPYAKRMKPETLAATRRRAVAQRLRASLGLPGLDRPAGG
jgi:hypothetical protein